MEYSIWKMSLMLINDGNGRRTQCAKGVTKFENTLYFHKSLG
jgi:hypothetical protein